MSIKKSIGFLIGCFFLFGFSLLNLPLGLTPDAVTMVGIFLGAITLWLTVDVGWPSLLVLFSLTQLDGVTISTVMANSLGNNTIAFLIFSCALTYALSTTGLLRRVALWFVNTPIAKKSPWAFAAMYFVSILVIGSFISPTVLFVLFFALAKEIYSINNLNKGNDYARMLMIGTAIMTSISCAMTPIAHTFPLMAIGFYESATGEVINWIDYMMIGVPSGLLAAAATFAVLWLGFRKKIGNLHIEASENTVKISRNEIVALIVFLIVVAMWMISGLFPTWIPILKTWTTTIPPMLGVIALCLFGIFNFNDAIKNGVPWTAIILCSATLAVGKWLTAAELGITDAIGAAMSNMLGTPNSIGLIFAIVAFAIIMTNLMSNIVTTTVAYNLLTPIVIATGVISPVLSTILIGIGASMAYATPPSIAHVALAAGSEYCDSKDMLKYGGIITIISIVLVTAFGFIFGGIL